MTRKLSLLALALTLSACATQTPYRPAESRNDYGYRETQLTNDRYRVTFSGNSSTGADVTKDFALLRAGELTLQKGYDWFQLVDRKTDKDVNYQTIDTGFYDPPTTSVYQRCGLTRCSTYVYTTPGFGFSGGSATTTSTTAYTSELEIVMGKKPMPKSAEAYDARELVATLRRLMEPKR
jgi:hypothetical protein